MASWQKLDLFLLSFYNGYPLVFEDLCTNIWWRNFIQSYIVFHITEHVYFSPFQVVSWSHMGWGQGPIPLRPRAQSRHHFWPPAPTHLPKPKPPGRKKRPSGNFRGLPAFSCPHHPPAYEGKIRTSNIVRTKKSSVQNKRRTKFKNAQDFSYLWNKFFSRLWTLHQNISFQSFVPT